MSFTKTQAQEQLRCLNFYYDKIDGIWGPNFRQATINFQRSHSNLAVDGVFGNNSWNQSVEDVADIQRMLNAKGAKLKVDGICGQKTIAAIKAFQKANKLVEDGIVGPKTLAALGQNKIDYSDYPNFKKTEFKCGCNGKYCNGYNGTDMSPIILSILEKTRKHFGNKPVNITSGIRCQMYNDSLANSIKTSMHRLGKAADFYIEGVSSADVVKYLQTLPEVSFTYAIDSGAVHVDIQY